MPVLVCILCLSGAFARCGWPSPLQRPTAARGGVADRMAHGWDRRQHMGDLGGSELTARAPRPMTEACRGRTAAESATVTAPVVRPPSQLSTTRVIMQRVDKEMTV